MCADPFFEDTRQKLKEKKLRKMTKKKFGKNSVVHLRLMCNYIIT